MLESKGLIGPLAGCGRVIFSVVLGSTMTLGQAVFPSAVPPAANAQVNSPAPPPPSGSSPGVLLGSSDLLDISVYGVPELSQKARINNSGDIYLPLVDYVHVDGLTPEEAQSVIEKRLADGGFVKNPHVVVLVTESATGTVSLLGEVARPGAYTLLGERRLLDIVSVAGGFTDRSGRTVTITHRDDPTHSSTVKLAPDFSPSSPSNVVVQPGDTIVVQKGPIFYVVGDVGKPSGFVSDSDTISILKAIALAGGPNRTAALNGTTILRKTPQGTQQIKVPLQRILRAKADDMPMQSEDILFVPSSTRKIVMARSAEAISQMATALTVVAVRP
jgi:polysaccharide biosynthesis/export protein